jgi:hypothetical protein
MLLSMKSSGLRRWLAAEGDAAGIGLAVGDMGLDIEGSGRCKVEGPPMTWRRMGRMRATEIVCRRAYPHHPG